MNRHRLTVAALPVIAAFALAACGSGRASTPGTQSTVLPGDSWQTTLERARGQTVRWWLYGGDERVNRYIDEHVAPRAARLGVTLRRVAIDDTASAVQRVASELRAGRDSGGGVADLDQRRELRTGQGRRAVAAQLGRPAAQRAPPR